MRNDLIITIKLIKIDKMEFKNFNICFLKKNLKKTKRNSLI